MSRYHQGNNRKYDPCEWVRFSFYFFFSLLFFSHEDWRNDDKNEMELVVDTYFFQFFFCFVLCIFSIYYCKMDLSTVNSNFVSHTMSVSVCDDYVCTDAREDIILNAVKRSNLGGRFSMGFIWRSYFDFDKPNGKQRIHSFCILYLHYMCVSVSVYSVLVPYYIDISVQYLVSDEHFFFARLPSKSVYSRRK